MHSVAESRILEEGTHTGKVMKGKVKRRGRIEGKQGEESCVFK